MKAKLLAMFFVALAASVFGAAGLVAEKVPCAVADKQDFEDPDRVKLTGWVGSRVTGNEQNRLLKIDTARLLEGYRKRPGRQSWDGEHVGKWLHAATLAWVNSGDAALREKLDTTVAELMKCQLEDGYLGTYLDKDRWSEWDVWAHKYNLLGLITYMRYTGNIAPLSTCTRMADLLCRTFGEKPGQRDIIKAGHHVGMAPTSVLEPMVWLYRLTGEQRYLEFCKYILRAWEQPNGPHIISRLTIGQGVNKVGNGKAYEMLSCLNGALEYYRTVGDKPLLDACLNAWQDIVDKRLYITGAASYHELFHDDFDLPNVANVGETCVTTTWIQFNAHLLRLTGEARFAEQLERVVINQLFGAQKPDCTGWGYYVQMEGRKPYSTTLDGHCCLSSGPRGVALIPTFALSTDADGVVVNLYDAGTARLSLRDQTSVTLALETKYPSDGKVQMTLTPAAEKRFAVKLRLPTWSRDTRIRVNGEATKPSLGGDGYASVRRTWKPGDRVEVQFTIEPRLVIGDHLNAGKVAFLCGPLVFAADERFLPDAIKNLSAVTIATTNIVALKARPDFDSDLRALRVTTQIRKTGAPAEIKLVAFADAGDRESRYKVWLPLPRQPSSNVLRDGIESRSRPGNLSGSIIDDENDSVVVTFDNKPAAQDWFAVTLDEVTTIRRVVFRHGKTFHDGGWFDASAGKPQVQLQRKKGGAWETLGELTDYPATTATDSKNLKAGQAFTFSLSVPEQVHAVRVIGKPACGDNARQSFASCAELQAFAE